MAQDPDAQELLERRIVERVENQVRSRLFAIYGIIGGGVLGALAWFGYDVITDFRATVDKTAFETAEKQAKISVSGAVEDANAAAEDASAAAEEARNEVITAKANLKALSDQLSDAQKRLGRTLVEIDEMRSTVEDRLLKIRNDISDTDVRIERALTQLKAGLTDAQQEVDAFKSKTQDFYLSAKYENIIADLAADVVTLSKALTALQEGAAAGDALVLNSVGIRSEIDATNAAVGQADDVTVYFQFAGIAREIAEDIAAGLKLRGYNVPGEERIGTAAGKTEIRYFFEEDADSARRAATATNAVLQSLGYRDGVTARFVNLLKGAPRPGILELWLEPRPA